MFQVDFVVCTGRHSGRERGNEGSDEWFHGERRNNMAKERNRGRSRRDQTMIKSKVDEMEKKKRGKVAFNEVSVWLSQGSR